VGSISGKKKVERKKESSFLRSRAKQHEGVPVEKRPLEQRSLVGDGRNYKINKNEKSAFV